MALPIQPTPILKGKDAERFINLMQNSKKAPRAEQERIRELTTNILSKANGTLFTSNKKS